MRLIKLKLPQNIRVTLYQDTHYQGEQITFEPGGYPCLSDYHFNDETYSVCVEAPP
ncbi:Beta/Gamma crystallin [Gloeocapsa sp. PCC 73106]|nr:Beta/Gamma crystallin [Gloeocapsa sp. PCC 73106]